MGQNSSQVLQLGNYLGALSNWVRLQDTATPSDTLLFSLVGLHAITIPQGVEKLRENRRDAMASLLAIGLDPSKSIIFHQEDVSQSDDAFVGFAAEKV